MLSSEQSEVEVVSETNVVWGINEHQGPGNSQLSDRKVWGNFPRRPPRLGEEFQVLQHLWKTPVQIRGNGCVFRNGGCCL